MENDDETNSVIWRIVAAARCVVDTFSPPSNDVEAKAIQALIDAIDEATS